VSIAAGTREETRVAAAVMGDEIACCARSITGIGSGRARSSSIAGCAAGPGTRSADFGGLCAGAKPWVPV
jgi:hypothetical protein